MNIYYVLALYRDYHFSAPKYTYEMEMFVIVIADEGLGLGEVERGLQLKPRSPTSTWRVKLPLGPSLRERQKGSHRPIRPPVMCK